MIHLGPDAPGIILFSSAISAVIAFGTVMALCMTMVLEPIPPMRGEDGRPDPSISIPQDLPETTLKLY